MQRSRTTPLATTVALVTAVLLAGCFRLVSEKTYAIGFETTRANLVVHTAATSGLYAVASNQGVAAARQLVLHATPPALPISTKQRFVLCAISTPLCLTAPQIGRTVVGWFRQDIAHRPDFLDALSSAARRHRCFAWTFVPRRNLTHKGLGTSGCATGGR